MIKITTKFMNSDVSLEGDSFTLGSEGCQLVEELTNHLRDELDRTSYLAFLGVAKDIIAKHLKDAEAVELLQKAAEKESETKNEETPKEIDTAWVIPLLALMALAGKGKE